MGNPEKASRRPKAGVLQAVELHKLINPPGGGPLIVGIDQATGQLFFLSKRGTVQNRLRAHSESVSSMVYEAWPQLRPSA